MATLNAVIVPAKALKDGRHKIRISVAHNGETRYIVTDIRVDSAKEFKNGAIVKRPDAAILNTKLRGLLQRYQGVIDDLEYVNGLSCSELVYQMKNAGNQRRRTLNSIVDEYFLNLCVKPSTVENYRSKWHRIAQNLDDRILAENVCTANIICLMRGLKKMGLSQTTIRGDLILLKAILNYATKCGYVQFRTDPFASVPLPQNEVRDCWLTVDEVKLIRDLHIGKKSTKKARDMFMLSYYLGGINMIDLCKINFNEAMDTIRYVRTKTEDKPKLNKYVEFEIPEEAKTIIDEYKRADGSLFMTEYQRNDKLHSLLWYHLRLIAEKTGIKRLIYYSARKSFSQHAFKLGVPAEVIDYILGHRVDKGSTSLYYYISVTPEMATDAIRKVLDNLK